MRIFAIIAILGIAFVSLLVFLYSFNLANGQLNQQNSGSSIALRPIYSPDNVIKKLFLEEFEVMTNSIGHND
ncbi:MAG: hypothetical protein WBL44_07200 [Nitrososphaeraceae archaeon]|jgi:hypothetical protein